MTDMEQNRADNGRPTGVPVKFGISNTVTAVKLTRLAVAKAEFVKDHHTAQEQDKRELEEEVKDFKELDDSGKDAALDVIRTKKRKLFDHQIGVANRSRHPAMKAKFHEESRQFEQGVEKSRSDAFRKYKAKPRWPANLRKVGTLERNVMGLGASAVSANIQFGLHTFYR